MKKIISLILAATVINAFAAQQLLDDQDATKVGLQTAMPKINTNFTELYGGSGFTQIVMTGNATITGKVTANGELEVNAGAVDINMTGTNNIFEITQTNTAGKADVPLMSINDDRTGGNADVAAEATIWIDAEGAYAIAIIDGILQVEEEIDTASGDLLLDPAGSDVIIDGGLSIGATNEAGDNNLRVDGLTASLPLHTDASKVLTSRSITNDDINANASIAATKIAGEAVVKTTVFATDATGVWNNLIVTNFANALVGSKVQAWDADLDTVALRSLVNMTNLAPAGVNGEAVVKTTVFAGDATGTWNTLVVTNISSGLIGTAVQAYDADLDAVALRSLVNMTNLAPAGVNGEAVVKTTVFAGGVTGTWDNLVVTSVNATAIDSGDLDPARMTAAALVTNDITASGDVFVGSGAGTFTMVTGVAATNFKFMVDVTHTGMMWFATGGILTNVVLEGY